MVEIGLAIEFGLGRSEYVVERICRNAVTAVTTITDTMATWATMGKGTTLGPVVSVSVSVVVVGPVVAIRFIRLIRPVVSVSDSDDPDDRANKRKSSSAGTVITDVVVTATAASAQVLQEAILEEERSQDSTPQTCRKI